MTTHCYRCGSKAQEGSSCPRCRTAIPRQGFGPVSSDVLLAERTATTTATVGPRVDTALGRAILGAILFPLAGLIALYYALSTRTAIRNGDTTEAILESEKARSWSSFAIACGLFLNIAAILLYYIVTRVY